MASIMRRFVKDEPPQIEPKGDPRNVIVDPIDGCVAVPLVAQRDSRGHLIELLTTRDEPIWSVVHVYQVFAEKGSMRGWVYHARQFDRLAYTIGRLRIGLHDLREESPTYGRTNVFLVGEENQVLLTIPPFVAHCVENIGDAMTSFINMPTRAYDPADPDKFRLAPGVLPYPGR